MNVRGTMVIAVNSAPIVLAHLNAAVIVDISFSEMVKHAEVQSNIVYY